jgi:hypothetical protein
MCTSAYAFPLGDARRLGHRVLGHMPWLLMTTMALIMVAAREFARPRQPAPLQLAAEAQLRHLRQRPWEHLKPRPERGRQE